MPLITKHTKIRSRKNNKSAEVIYSLFIKPFQRYFKKQGMNADAQDLLHYFFHAHDRKIFTARTNERVTIKGSLMQTAVRPLTGMKKALPKDVLLWIRMDKKENQYIDVEFDYLEQHRSEAETKTYVFRLTPQEFEGILKSITVL